MNIDKKKKRMEHGCVYPNKLTSKESRVESSAANVVKKDEDVTATDDIRRYLQVVPYDGDR